MIAGRRSRREGYSTSDLHASAEIRSLLGESTDGLDVFDVLCSLARRELARGQPEEALFFLVRAQSESKESDGLCKVQLLQMLAFSDLGDGAAVITSGLGALMQRNDLVSDLLPALDFWLSPENASRVNRHPFWGVITSGLEVAGVPALELVRARLLACRVYILSGQYQQAEAVYGLTFEHGLDASFRDECDTWLGEDKLRGAIGEDNLDLASLCRHWAPEFALSLLERDLNVRGELLVPETKALLHQTAGALRQDLNMEDAWWHHYSAGRLMLESGEPRAALEQLHTALALAPAEDRAPVCWYRMETERVLSFISDEAGGTSSHTLAALDAWDHGYQITAPVLDRWGSTWAYYSRALLCEQVARLGTEANHAVRGEALCYALCAMLFGQRDVPERWATGARYFRELNLRANAAAFAARAFELNPELPEALDEYLTSLVDQGQVVSALDVLARCRPYYALEKDWLGGLEARLSLLLEPLRCREGRDLAEKAVGERPHEAEWLWLRSIYCALDGDWGAAERDWKALRMSASGAGGVTDARAWATFYLALLERNSAMMTEAGAEFAELSGEPEYQFSALIVKALLSLVSADESGPREAAFHAGDVVPRYVDVAMLQRVHLRIIGDLLEIGTGEGTPVAELLRFATNIENERPWDLQDGDRVGELERCLASVPSDQPVVRLAIQFGLVQASLEKSNWGLAGEVAASMSLSSILLEEVACLPGKVADRAIDAGDCHWAIAPASAVGHWREARRIAEQLHDIKMLVRIDARLGVAAGALGEADGLLLLADALVRCIDSGLESAWVLNSIQHLFATPAEFEAFREVSLGHDVSTELHALLLELEARVEGQCGNV